MKLTVFNGSPRGARSNTRLLLEQFLRGFSETPGNDYELYYLNRLKEQPQAAQAFAKAKVVLLAYPLYTDAMPGMVKAFIELLGSYCNRTDNPEIGFIVQSGFREAAHSRYVERYHEKLARRLGCHYLGTVIRGGIEGIQMQPPNWTRKLFDTFYQLGKKFGQTGQFEVELVRYLAQPERLSWGTKLFYRLLSYTGMNNFYWDTQLKQNGAYEQRFARPYAEK